MRGFFTGICFFFFFLVAPTAIFSYLVNSFTAPDYVKGKLNESKIYDSVTEAIPQIVGFSEEKEGENGTISLEMENELKDLLAKEVTPTYLQEKSEQIIDSTYNWYSGETEDTPSVSFVDLKEKLVAYANAKGTELPEEITKPFSEPVKIVNPADEKVKMSRSAFQIFQRTPLMLGLFSAALLLAIFLLAESWKSKLRKVSLAFFVPGFLGLLSVLPVMFLFAFITGAISDSLKEPGWEALTASVKTLISAISTDVFKLMLTIYASLVIAAIILFIASLFVGNKSKTPAPVPVDLTPEKPAEDLRRD